VLACRDTLVRQTSQLLYTLPAACKGAFVPSVAPVISLGCPEHGFAL
jgi:hypothetical protein